MFESWVFPVKLLHDARMSIRVEGQDAPVDFASAVESVVVRPESTTLTASNQLFTIRATCFSPIEEAGTIVLLDVDTARPLTITVSFVPDLKLLLAATHIEASRAMRELGALMGDGELSAEAAGRHDRGVESLKMRYRDAQTGRFAHALTKSGGRNLEETAWLAMPLFYGQAESGAAAATLDALASARMATDWGARMLSRESAAYNPVGYNNGAVWPFLTGFVAAGLYEYQRPHAAFAYLRRLAQLTFDHGPGYQPEILSGRTYVFRVRGGLRVREVEGGRLVEEQGGWQRVAVAFSPSEDPRYVTATVAIRLGPR